MSRASAVPVRQRILHFIESSGIYGAENVILNLSREMQADGRYVPVVGCIVQRSDETVDLANAASRFGIEAHRIRISNRRVWLDLPLAVRWVRALRIDAIHCHGYKPAVFAYALSRITGVKLVATCHLWFIDVNAPWKMRMMIAIEKFLYRRYPTVVAVSEHIRHILLKNRVPAERTRVIKNGIVLADYAPSARRISQQGTIRVLNVARLAEQKGQADLIVAAELIAKQRPDVQIDIVGEGELRSVLEQQIVALGLSSTIRLLGFRDDVRELLKETDIFVLPSLDEGMPISLLEAVASKVPVIVTAVGDIPKLVTDGESGLIVRVGNPEMLAQAILRLASEADLRRKLAENAWSKLQRTFSSRQMFDEYAAVYESVLGKRH